MGGAAVAGGVAGVARAAVEGVAGGAPLQVRLLTLASQHLCLDTISFSSERHCLSYVLQAMTRLTVQRVVRATVGAGVGVAAAAAVAASSSQVGRTHSRN